MSLKLYNNFPDCQKNQEEDEPDTNCPGNCNDQTKTDSPKGLDKELLDARVIIISEEVSSSLAKRIYSQLLLLNAKSDVKPINVYINSVGGDADSGFGIYDMMRFVTAPVNTIVCGLCASAGVTIAQGATAQRRFATPTSRFLLHQPSTGIYGDVSDVTITAQEILKTRERYNAIIAATTSKSIEEITKDADRDFWMSPEEAKTYGLVDAIITNFSEIPQ